jgi:alpha-tubulin suppressor-like RCC1 family protein
VTITPSAHTFSALNRTHQFSAVARNATGTTIPGQTFTWNSSNTSVATVSASGLATARGNGEAQITASVSGVQDAATITVLQLVNGVDVTPATYTLEALDDEYQFGATAKDANEQAVAGETFIWTSSNASVATVDPASGLATAMGNGTAEITATTGGFSGNAELTVSQSPDVVEVAPATGTLTTPGETVQLSAVARDANDNLISGASFSWGSSDPDVASVNPTTGLVTAVGSGDATVTATLDGVSGNALITVQLGTSQTVTAGGVHSCALSGTGTAYCWGLNQNAQLGTGNTTTSTSPIAVQTALAFQRLTAGDLHTCALTGDGLAYCWGANSFGQLGDGTTIQRTTPVAVVGSVAFESISASGASGNGMHTCGVTSGGSTLCWGANSRGQLGDGTTINRSNPVAVSGGLAFETVTAGGLHTCGLTTAREAWCWGENFYGELGDGTTISRLVPVRVAGGLSFISLDAGFGHTCGVTTSGAAYCWGRNDLGQLGNGTNNDQMTPVPVSGGLTFTAVSAGGRADVIADHTCGLTLTGALYCWGSNTRGQLGNGTTVNSNMPAAVSGGLAFDLVSSGGYHTCALTSDAATYCWGWNRDGQVGDGTTVDRHTPVPVQVP